ncbi:MlrC C-terminal domain-containing protein, partial [Cupriavidus necator]|uniref:MlrC C-terminal domain-containing protein n=1 Tax=Cupriavidus necator TaxID=106590 RepID=UPI0030F484C0
HREAFRPTFPTSAQGVALALSAAEGPVDVNEYADNPGGGTPGDGTHLLRALLDTNPPAGTCCFASINDAAAGGPFRGSLSWPPSRWGGP